MDFGPGIPLCKHPTASRVPSLFLAHSFYVLEYLSRSPRWFCWLPRNLLTLGREFESSVVKRTGIFPNKKNKMPNNWRTTNSLQPRIRLHDRRGKETAESFSKENLSQALQNEGEEILCDLPPL